MEVKPRPSLPSALRRALAALALAGAPLAALAQSGGAAVDPRCVPTDSDHLGPFYVSDMPVVEDLNLLGSPGERVEAEGLLLSATDGNPPVAGGVIEIWHADSKGDYQPADNGKRGDFDAGELGMRGTVVSDGEGRYSFKTIVPDPEGLFRRDRHFHYRISAEGHRTLVTQHYIDEEGEGPTVACRSSTIQRDGNGASLSLPPIFLVRE